MLGLSLSGGVIGGPRTCGIFQEPKRQLTPGRKGAVTRAEFDMEEFKAKAKKTWDSWQFESWAPPSSRAWRLREIPSEVSLKAAAEAAEREMTTEAATGDLSSLRDYLEALDAPPAQQDASQAFAARVATLEKRSEEVEEAEEGGEEEYEVEDLTAQELITMCHAKYGKYHDMSIKQTRLTGSGEGMRRWVWLNIYVGHYGQKSFPYTEAEYVDKVDSVVGMLNAWNQQEWVRAFFREKPTPKRGLPSYPRVDTAVSLRLNGSPTWDDKLTEGFFTY